MKKILIVEDQRIPREYIKRILFESGRYEVVGSLSDASLAVVKCAKEHIDLILMDVVTNGDIDGIEAAKEIKKKNPTVKTVIITSMLEVGYLDRAKKAGVDSFWHKDKSKESLIEVIDKTIQGECVFPDEICEVQLGLASSLEFTKREIDVLRLVCEGLDYGEIAEILNISHNTVKTHVVHILQKTGYENKTRLVIAAVNKKFIVPGIAKDLQDY